jgi:signal transduction histidine kinase
LNEARRSVWNLRPETLEHLSLVEAIKQEVGRFAQTSNVKARCDISGNIRSLPIDVDTAILRICQESLTNTRKHAEATEVKVSINFGKSNVTLSVRDNGVGLNTEGSDEVGGKRHGFGLISMQERARNLGGTFEVQSEEGKGTVITVMIPVM